MKAFGNCIGRGSGHGGSPDICRGQTVVELPRRDSTAPERFPTFARMYKHTSLTVLICASLLGCAAAKPEPDPDDGLVRVETSLLDELYVAPNVSLAHYQRVMLDPIDIEFKDGWRQGHPDLSDRDFEHFKSQLTSDLHDTLLAEFTRGGYTIAEAPAQDVLRVRAGIADADF